MDFTDMPRVTSLTNEKLALQQAIMLLATGGRITGMTIGGGEFHGTVPRPPGMPSEIALAPNIVSIPTGYISYPPQMATSIQTALQERIRVITEELQQLGITGVG